MSAIGIDAGTARGKTFAVSAYADIRHGHLVFERQQSLALREMEWEGRLTPLMPWSSLILRWAAAATVVLAVYVLLV